MAEWGIAIMTYDVRKKLCKKGRGDKHGGYKRRRLGSWQKVSHRGDAIHADPRQPICTCRSGSRPRRAKVKTPRAKGKSFGPGQTKTPWS